jgi:poly-gamma-glutamate capsule biosynthesis protein CapA/YwtB (metallophosphatase superfamily)
VRKPVKTAAVLVGLGVGVALGPSLGPAAVWSGVAIAVLGVALCLVGTTESDLVGDDLVDPDEDTEVSGDGTSTGATVAAARRRNRQRSGLSGLGTRVEQILRLAEEQADDHRAEARRESEAILNRAHEEAARITGARDGSPVPPSRAAAPNDSPGPVRHEPPAP